MDRKEVFEKDPRLGLPSLSALVLLSGFASLVYQVLWMRHLGLLFGNGSQAAAATLAMFFGGLGLGSWWWGRRKSSRPLRLYAILELGIAISALVYFVTRFTLSALYPVIYATLGNTPWLLVAKLVMAGLLIFPAAFFMGGTVPVMAQVVIRERSRFGRLSAWLYGINTLGATLGVLMGAFVLLPSFGLRISYAIAVLCSLLVTVWAWRGANAENLLEFTPKESAERVSGRLDPMIGMLAFVSGFVVLGLEVVWVRIYAQVHENSVYSFAVILAIVLLGLAIGASIGSLLSRLEKSPKQILMNVMLIAGALLVIGPTMIMAATKDLQPVHTNESWSEYLVDLFRMGIGGVGFTAVALGIVFPFLMKMVERDVCIAGRMLGRLLAVNTLGAILGSLVCGFLLLPFIGMWTTLRLLTMIHLCAALMVPLGWQRRAVMLRGGVLILILLLHTVFNPTNLRVLSQIPGGEALKVLEVWEANDCNVAVVEKPSGHRAIMVNASYSLGSTAAFTKQANQARIPLYLYPETRSVCFIGIGTGMSAGASLDKDRFPGIERVLACELSPAVVEAAKEYMPAPMLSGLFNDDRCEILIEDGRHHLMASKERFDMINADLFLPYRRGAGSLYSLDHYKVVAQRLNEKGVFVQWLPMYQITEFEFGVIVNTMLQVFEEVTMWRNDFTPGQETVALMGKRKSEPVMLPPAYDLDEMRSAVAGLSWQETTSEMVQVEPESMPFFYAGNLSSAAKLFKDFPLNTDDQPIIEFQTPWRFRNVAATDEIIWCVGPKLASWIERIFNAAPVVQDPALAGHTELSRHLVDAGGAFHQAMVSKALGNRWQTEIFWDEFKQAWIKAATPTATTE